MTSTNGPPACSGSLVYPATIHKHVNAYAYRRGVEVRYEESLSRTLPPDERSVTQCHESGTPPLLESTHMRMLEWKVGG